MDRRYEKQFLCIQHRLNTIARLIRPVQPVVTTVLSGLLYLWRLLPEETHLALHGLDWLHATSTAPDVLMDSMLQMDRLGSSDLTSCPFR
jgi:hypothetical protein